MPQFLLGFALLEWSQSVFAVTQDGRWHLGIGDPTMWGWLTVAVYLLAVARCYVKAKRDRAAGAPYQFWLYLGVFLLLLSINKQLDLQTWVSQTLRDLSLAHGWYEQRRMLQLAFVISVGSVMLVLLITLRIYLWNLWRSYKLVWSGLILLCAFILIRAASFHHVDILIRQTLLGLELNVLLENLALVLIILGTFFHRQPASFPPTVPNEKTLTNTGYYEAPTEGADVFCPRCATKAVAKAAHGRPFKCKYCAHKYLVYVNQ